ncbi:AMP-binding protein [Brevibacterium sp. 50QC2O2]|uniref:AMP-binding protein n=1 Tax=Brevibacterium sp. 50QC2O2 TaxID=2968459 RepID=UPI00211BA5EA|nr:AMP-binding protein [Brevibacterium sp. 50QC2O2]MCQ9389868.1 AMP-binding protein [Brevibacterium sp. 50QC2O2]
MAIAPDYVDSLLAQYAGPDANAAYLMCDRHDPATVAFTLVDDDLSSREMTFGELHDRSARLATTLHERGIGVGDRVGVLLTKRAELPVTLLALARVGAVYIPLFTAFAHGAVEMRMQAAGAKLVVTEPGQVEKLAGLPDIQKLVAGPDFAAAEAAEPLETSASLGPDAPFLQLYTSGTTGSPKGVPVPIRAMAAFHAYHEVSLDQRADDVFWNNADPGWAYGLYYGIVGPLIRGLKNILHHMHFTPESTFAVMEKFQVTNFASAPTVYRALSKSGLPTTARLRVASSAGEPLTADVTEWSQRVLGSEVRDHYGQTETGMLICTHWNPVAETQVKPMSMGTPLPGIEGTIRDGVISFAADSPMLWFMGYADDPAKTATRYTADGQWYLTGDLGRTDEDGYFYYISRDDDIILMAGYRIGPFDVESVIINHPAVADVAVVGRPDPSGVRGELAEAFVVLAPGVAGSDALATELKLLVKENYSAHAYPRCVHFVDQLPKTESGKVQRGVLRKLEL